MYLQNQEEAMTDFSNVQVGNQAMFFFPWSTSGQKQARNFGDVVEIKEDTFVVVFIADQPRMGEFRKENGENILGSDYGTVTQICQSVKAYFADKFPHLVDCLDNGGGFWPDIKTNSSSNKDLARNIFSCMALDNMDSYVFQASAAILSGRLLGFILNPEQ
jgi:hypothetical protein